MRTRFRSFRLGKVCEDSLSQHFEKLSVILREKGLRYHAGRVWSLPAPFREYRWKLREYHEKWNVLGVEMEVCSLLAITVYYGIDFSSLQIVSDTVYPEHHIGFHEEKLENSIRALYSIVEKYVGQLG